MVEVELRATRTAHSLGTYIGTLATIAQLCRMEYFDLDLDLDFDQRIYFKITVDRIFTIESKVFFERCVFSVSEGST